MHCYLMFLTNEISHLGKINIQSFDEIGIIVQLTIGRTRIQQRYIIGSIDSALKSINGVVCNANSVRLIITIN